MTEIATSVGLSNTSANELGLDPVEGADEGDLNTSSMPTIDLDKFDRSLADLQRLHTEGLLVLDPEWQRNYVWRGKQPSKLIESFLLGIPVPVVYLAQRSDEKYEVIDGQQRLTSIFDFLENRFKLRGLDILTDLNGLDYKSLDSKLQQKLRNSALRSFEFSNKTDSEMHFIIFERLNTGGTKLNEMEIRNCIYRGPLNRLIADLSENKDFVSVLNQNNVSVRMHDRALVLRFLAFYERTHLKCTKGPKSFLNEFFETYRHASEDKLREFQRVFEKCMKASITVFGDNGFRLKTDDPRSKSLGEWANRPNAAIFQAVATSFAPYELGQITRAADRIYEEYIDLVSTDGDWVDRIRRQTGDTTRIAYVFEEWQRRLAAALEDTPPNDGQRVFSLQLKRQLFEQDGTCGICGQQVKLLDDAVIDHVEHYWRGGATIPENARIAHRYCNSARGGSD